MVAISPRLQTKLSPQLASHHVMSKGIRKNITIPGLLATALRLRAKEFGLRTLSPFVFDLVSYDLKSGAPHTITIAIAEDTQAAQDAVDAEIAHRYRPGQPRQGLLVQLIERLNEMRSLARNTAPAPQLSARPERVMFPSLIWDLVEARWQELGYSSLSAYITGLVRYDLLISGPHRSLPPTTNRAKQDTVARQTLVRCRRGQRRKLYLDHLIEKTEGRPLNTRELEAMKAKIAQHLQGLFCEP
jgi:hypothetical protein